MSTPHMGSAGDSPASAAAAAAAATAAWSKYPAKAMVAESEATDRRRLERTVEQLQAVCEVHAATSNALCSTEERNVQYRQEVEDLRTQVEVLADQNAKLCADQQHAVQQMAGVKDKYIHAHEKLGALAEYQVERGELLRQSRDQAGAVAQLRRENEELRREAGELRVVAEARGVQADKWQRQAEAQLRCNEVVTDECARLKRAMAKGTDRRAQRDADAAVLQMETRQLEERLRRSERCVEARDRSVHEAEEEGRRLKRERVQALRALQDEQDAARERELLLRQLRRDNAELRERLHVLTAAPEDLLVEVVQGGGAVTGGAPIPVVEVGVPPVVAPAADNVLLNLKKQNKLHMQSLTNTLQQLMYTVDKKEKMMEQIQ